MVRTDFEPASTSFGRSVKIGGIVTASSQAVVTGVKFASVIVLSRLLSPADFGIIAMSWPVVALLSLFQDFGLPQATIQRKAITVPQVNFLFWANLGISALVALSVLAIAPVAASFYQEPRVQPFIMAMGALILVQGLGAQHGALLARMMHFRALALMEMAGAVAGLAVAVGWALLDPSPWALFGGSLATVLLPVTIAWCITGWYPTRPRIPADARSLVNFGAGITGFNITNFVARNADNILIGRFLGQVQLGLYDRAYKLLLMPLRQVTNPLSRIMVPALSRMAGQPDRFRNAFMLVLRLLLLAVLPGVAAMIVVARDLVPFLLGPEWSQAAVAFTALGFAGLLQPLNNPAGWLFVSEGRGRDFMIWGVINAVTCVAAFVAGLPYGIVGVAVAYALSEYLRTPILWWFVGRRGSVRFRDVLVGAGPILLATHAALVVVWVVQPELPANVPARALLSAILSYAIVGTATLLLPGGRTLARQVLDAVPFTRRFRAAYAAG